MKTLNVRLPDTTYDLLKASATNNRRSLNDEMIAAIEGPLFSEDDVEMASTYLRTLNAIQELEPDWTDDDVEIASGYLATLQAIQKLEAESNWKEDDLAQAQGYLATLQAIDEATNG